MAVSTHSRPKAAGKVGVMNLIFLKFQHTAARRRLAPLRLNRTRNHSFNTQPPEGGWGPARNDVGRIERFQHTAARRRLGRKWCFNGWYLWFQHTAARRRLGNRARLRAARQRTLVSTHSRPKAAGFLIE
ncbi:hypothetical protein NEIMUCOT_04696 [Neisseria mucosa ATCC 25996]|uniref:Uncharacterized protein n=1 Tax=Neisseria mucosa (strain ATCC 25996 / DSM 4631 / NCTC 10774 / M26) TaxID=546266 RepID=D2ZVQ3_NEIM2|nr:hypothetical protein NEIMUCOT_04696 [Neisseria mucosa ATCC 25996]